MAKAKYLIEAPFVEGAITHKPGLLEYDGPPSLKWEPLNEEAYLKQKALYDAKKAAVEKVKGGILRAKPPVNPAEKVVKAEKAGPKK